MVKLKFHGSEQSETHLTTLEAFTNVHGDLFICIEEYHSSPVHICLEKDTAIKLVKTLKSEISKMQ